VQTRILAKVGMTGSNVRHSAAAAGGDVAAPHAPIDGKVRPIAPFDSDNTNPAGGINASAEDMAKWLRVLLAHGKLADGTRLFSEDTWRQLTTIVTPIPIGDPPRELPPLAMSFNGYGLGLGVRDYRGHKALMHTGGLPGYVSRVAWIPDAGVGVAVLTNQESTAAFDSIAFHVLDHYLGAPSVDWIDGYARLEKRITAARSAMGGRGPGSDGPANAYPPAKYAGTYRDAWYGDVTIAEGQGRLTITFSHTPALTGTLDHFERDTFVARWRDRELRADAFVTFALNPDGSIDQVKMAAVSPDTDFSYDFQDLLLRPVRPR
jgi:CubicO group peptidase (beta-lactamase class C family)